MEREPEPKRVVRAGTSLALFIFSLECWASEGRGPRSCGCTETTNGNCFIWNRSDLPPATGRNPRVPENIKTTMRSGNTSWRESTGCSSTGTTRMYAITQPSSCALLTHTRTEVHFWYHLNAKMYESLCMKIHILTGAIALFVFVLRRNCILADEMGLGKTIQSITFLYEIYLKRIHGPFLVIAPLSTIPNWEREFRTWTELNVVVYHGSQASRKTIQAYDMYYRDTQVRNATFVMWYAFYNFGVIGANVSQVICRTYIRLYMTLYIGLCSQGPIIVTKSSFPAGSCNKGSLQIPCNHHHIWDDSDGLPRASECAVALCDHWWGS